MKRLREEDNLTDERVYESEWKALRRVKATTVNADYSASNQNRNKNRYSDILALNCSRVKLSYVFLTPSRLPSPHRSDDYIHANYVDGVRAKAYIATQAPLPRTFGDFWGMVHDENVNAIVMLTKLFEQKAGKSGKMRAKADRYWPSRPGLICQYGAIEVEFVSETYGPDIEERHEKGLLDDIGMDEDSESASVEYHWCVRRFMIKKLADKDATRNNSSNKINLRNNNTSPSKSKQSSPSRTSQRHKEKAERLGESAAFHERLSSMRTERDGEEAREVVQFHFQSWPDQSVPNDTDALLRFMRLVNDTVHRNVLKEVTRNNCNSNGAIDANAMCKAKERKDEIATTLPAHSPLLVHCSAGVGRTGVYCLVDAWINKFQSMQSESVNSNSCGNAGGGLTRSNSNLCYLNTCSAAIGPVSEELTNLFQSFLSDSLGGRSQVCSNSDSFNSNSFSTPTQQLLPLASLPPSHSIKSLLLAMRRQRSEFVQSLEQYKFCYEVLNHYLASNALATFT